MAGALPCAEHLRACVEQTTLDIGALRLNLTVSVGVAAMAPDIEDEEQLLRRADDALIQAKRTGRNRVCRWRSDMQDSSKGTNAPA